MNYFIKIIGFIFVAINAFDVGAVKYNTSKALIEIHDLRFDKNPIKSMNADKILVSDVKKTIKPKQGQAVAVVCKGNFPLGYIASDLFFSDGNLNRDFSVNSSTTVLDICHQQEEAMRIKNPSRFK